MMFDFLTKVQMCKRRKSPSEVKPAGRKSSTANYESKSSNASYEDTKSLKMQVSVILKGEKYDVEEFYHNAGCLQAVARSHILKNVTFAVILLNTLWIGIDTDCNKEGSGGLLFVYAENVFCAFFTFELAVRFAAFRRTGYAFSDGWFAFDFCLVAMMVWETWVGGVVASLLRSEDKGGGMGNTMILRVFRLFRLTRVGRMARLLRWMPELMLLCMGIVGSVRSLLSTLFLLIMIIYMFAIIFVQMLADSDDQIKSDCFPGVVEGMNCLLINGVFADQKDLITDARAIHWGYYVLVMTFLLIGQQTIMNMLIGVICEVIGTVAEVEKEELMVASVKEKIGLLLPSVDVDSDGIICRAEFINLLKMPEAVRTLYKFEVDVVALIDYRDVIFASEEAVSIGKFMETVFQFRTGKSATVKDLVDLSKFVSLRLEDIVNRVHGRASTRTWMSHIRRVSPKVRGDVSLKCSMFGDPRLLKAEVVRHLTQPEYDVEDRYHDKGFWQRVARNHLFKNMTFSVILLNTIWIGIDTDLHSRTSSIDEKRYSLVVNNIFCAYFSFELLARFLAFGRKRDALVDPWFVFDSSLVSTMAWETWITPGIALLMGASGGYGLKGAALFRMFRLLRIARVGRMARALRDMPQLLVLCKGLLHAARSVFSTLFLMVLLIYIFAIVFVQLLSGTPEVSQYFSSIPQAMHVLMLNGIFTDQADIINQMKDTAWPFYVLVLVFLTIGLLALANMLIGVICDVIHDVAELEKEDAGNAEVKKQLELMLATVDPDGDRMVSQNEFRRMAANPEVLRILQDLEVDVLALIDSGELIFRDCDEIPFEKFADYALQLRGNMAITVKDVVGLRKFVSMELEILEQKLLGGQRPEGAEVAHFVGNVGKVVSIRTPPRLGENLTTPLLDGEDDDIEKMKADLHQLREQDEPEYEVEDMYRTTGCWQAVARTDLFKNATFVVILLNTVWIGIDTDFNHAHTISQAPLIFQVVENLFCAYFAVEVLVRFMAFRHAAHAFRDGWFVFDSALVAMMVWETWAVLAMTSIMGEKDAVDDPMKNTSLFRVFRLLRLTRVGRMARLLKAVPELLVLVKGAIKAMSTVFWTMFLLTLCLYIFAIVFVQALPQNEAAGFANVPQAMISLLVKGIFADQSAIMASMQSKSWVHYVIYLLFMLVGSCTVMNMLIGVICEVIGVAADVEKERMSVQAVQNHVGEIMSALDSDEDRMVSREEYMQMSTNPELVRALDELGVDVVAMADFADIVFGGGEQVPYEKFMEAVLQFRGQRHATVKELLYVRKFLAGSIGRLEERVGVEGRRWSPQNILAFGTLPQDGRNRKQHKSNVFPDSEKLKRELRGQLTMPAYHVEEFYHDEGMCQALVRNASFKNTTYAVIFANAIWIGVDTDLNTAPMLIDADLVFQIAEQVFCTYFTFEIVTRFMAFKRKAFAFQDGWFVFDATLVSMMIWETWIVFGACIIAGGNVALGGSDTKSSMIFRIFRLFRLLRVGRLARILKMMPELLVLIRGLTYALRSMLSTLILLILVLYVFSIILVQMLDESDSVQFREVSKCGFETVPAGMHCLLITGIFADQADYIVEMLTAHWVYYIMVLVYMLIGSLSLMNMLIGVICDGLSEVAEVDKDEARNANLREGIVRFLSNLDENKDNLISRDEFKQLTSNPEAIRFLDACEVDVLALVDFADIIFGDCDELSYDEFLEKVFQFQGDKSVTVKDVVDFQKFASREIDKAERALMQGR